MAVGTTSAAMSMLSKGKQKIDVMIINIHPTNMISFNLLTQAMALDVISVVKKALDEGAHLYLQKPFNVEIMKYLWQLVLREKKQRAKLAKESEKNRDHKNVDDTDEINVVRENEEQPREKKIVANAEEQKYNIDEVENDDCREWTNDLHSKFMKAVQELGEGRCYPKEILEVMIHDVPDLTQMQVASHLQKCRRNDWRAPQKRKHIRQSSSQGSSNDSKQKTQNYAGDGIQQHGALFEMLGSQGLQDPIIENTNYSPALEFDSENHHNHNISDFSFDLNVAHGETYSNCGTFGTEIRNATINKYSLNVNADKVSDSYVGSATFNELGVANTNFQQYIGEPNMSNPSSIIGASYVN
ncbi:two-component response regulator ARR2-like [Solanum stenotomum]|uniref:two-component response regulator ARR2-like n=1 Tax=Solanum stenotomum TaxID=172797 RepID=UPI0020CFFA6B|nr:two-component response regulator ARR2-like [Solanum stenotomum]